MRYKLLSTKSFEKGFRKLSLDVRRKVDWKIRQLEGNPHLGRPLHGDLKGRCSLRIGDYRVIYMVNEEARVLDLIAAGHRKNVYKP